MAATIITSSSDLKTLLSSNAGKKIGVCTAGVITGDPSDSKRINLDALYTLAKMRTLEDISICCLLEKGSSPVTMENIVSNVNDNINDFLCDYVYIDQNQLSETTLIGKESKVFIPFVESEGVCQITRYIPYNMPFPFSNQQKSSNDVSRRKLVSQFLYFKWETPETQNIPAKNQILSTILSNVNINTSTLEQVNQVVSSVSQFYKILNLDGTDVTIDDLRSGKAIIFFYSSNSEKSDPTKFRSYKNCWLGFGKGDLFDFSSKTFERNVCDVEIDVGIDTIWESFEFPAESIDSARDNMKNDIKIYYWGKKV